MRWDPPAGVTPLVTDQRLTRNFELNEFPLWWLASPLQVAQLRAQLSRFWQPLRDRWGAMIPTSWLWSRSTGEPRTGAHADPGTADMVPRSAVLQFQLRDDKLRAHDREGARAHELRGQELVSETHAWAAANLPGSFGKLIDERDHLHVTAPGVGGTGVVLHEPTEGQYSIGPFPVPLAAGGLLLLAYLLYLAMKGRT